MKLQALLMSEPRARAILDGIDGEVFIRFRGSRLQLDGDLTAEQLLALSWWLTNRPGVHFDGVTD